MKLKNTYYIMRHGESEGNVKGLIVSSPETGKTSFGLTAKGRSQVIDSLNNLPVQDYINIVFSSDFLRAVETAEIAADILGTGEVKLHEALRERFFGEYDGKSDENYDEIWEIDRECPSEYPRNIEPPSSVKNRVAEFIKNLESLYKDEGILLVSHGDTLQITGALFRGLDPCRHREIEHLDKAEIRKLEPGETIIF